MFLLNIAELVTDLENSLRRVEVILIQQPGLTANLKDIQHQTKVIQVTRNNKTVISIFLFSFLFFSLSLFSFFLSFFFFEKKELRKLKVTSIISWQGRLKVNPVVLIGFYFVKILSYEAYPRKRS